MRVSLKLALPPFRQVSHAGHRVRNHLVVEIVQILVAHRLRHLTCAIRLLLGLLDNRPVGVDELVVREPLLNLTFHKSLTNQEITSLERVDAPPLHGAPLHDGQPIQQHIRFRHCGAT